MGSQVQFPSRLREETQRQFFYILQFSSKIRQK